MHSFDLDISIKDIQGFANADSVAAFFAHLGYNTNNRVVQKPENLGITADTTTRPIQHIELIADQETMLQVYLFELKSVTLTHTRNLIKAFKNRTGNYFFVLTSDYERIDFVLLEKYLPTTDSGTATIGTRQIGVRPRVLTVDRKKPGKIEMRVLRRFTYTESDPFAQYYKLISAFGIADWSEEHFNNRALFSDYYLLERLPEFPEWREDPKLSYLFFRDLYLNASSKYANQNEDYLRVSLFEPIFQHLGFSWGEGKKSNGASHEQADYVLKEAGGDDTLAVALTYPWGRSLDGKDDQRDNETPEENPNALVVSLLQKEVAPWAIVSNGKLWRLYSAKTHSRATNYYEIDLEEIIAASGPGSTALGESFRYFWLFFRAPAFIPKDMQREGEAVKLSFLDRLLAESGDYAKELGERLKERVFTQVFPHLASGFIHYIREQEGKDTELGEDRLDSIFQGTLTLLYRLLFLFFAESRDLLPAKETRGYYEASLSKTKRVIAENSNDIEGEADKLISRNFKDTSYSLYERLIKLFVVVDEGDSSLNVPVYNGGLFLSKTDPNDFSAEAINSRFLADHKIPDRHLALALDRLARDLDDKKQSLVFVDYKSLGVRQLGSIYEGLLEFKIRIADKKYGVVVKKKIEVYEPFSKLSDSQKRKAERSGKIVNKGEVYLENDKRERKATGSYYTPDHIVKYIVENAVGPILTEKFEKLRPRLRDAQKRRHDFLAEQKAHVKPGLQAKPESKVNLIKPELVDELFDINVLDPAMGSGHFLVQTVDFITDKALDFLSSFPWNPIVASLEQTRRTILEQMEEQGISVDPKRLTDVNLLKRQVLKRCIYGVDLNPMAVELSKVSLWLDCFTLGAPLSFLDHHLRCGNSLIGSTVEEVREAIEIQKGEQIPLLGSRFAGIMLAVERMKQVGFLSDITSEQVRESRSKYNSALSILEPYKRILDVYTSQWFGNGTKRIIKEHRAMSLLKAIEIEVQAFFNAKTRAELSKALGGMEPEDREVAETALESAAQKRFFHWELEYPEVFYGAREGSPEVIERLEGAGFDVVIGNPPYRRELDFKEELREISKTNFGAKYKVARMDLWYYFVHQAIHQLRQNGLLSFIVNAYWVAGTSATKLVNSLRTQANIIEIFYLGKTKVFENVSGQHMMICLKKSTTLKECRVLTVDSQETSQSKPFVEGTAPVNSYVKTYASMFVGDKIDIQPSDSEIIPKLKQFTTLSQIGKIRQGIAENPATINNKTNVKYGNKWIVGQGVFALTKRELADLRLRDFEMDLIVPYHDLRDIDRYFISPEPSLYLIYSTRDTCKNINEFPKIKDHLFQFKAVMDNRRETLKGSNSWWHLHWPREENLWKSDKIICIQMAQRPTFAPALGTLYVPFSMNVFVPNPSITEHIYYITAVLNSKLLWKWFRHHAKRRGVGLEINGNVFGDAPIKRIKSQSEIEKHDEIVILVKELLELKKQENLTSSNDEIKRLTARVRAIEIQIELILYSLYGLTKIELEKIESEFSDL